MARRLADPAALRAALHSRWTAVWGPDGWRNAPPWQKKPCGWHGRPAIARWNWTVMPVRRPARGDVRAVQVDIAAHARLAEELPIAVHGWAATTMRALGAAKAAYQARLAELGEELEEAEGCDDPGRAAKARVERDFLVGAGAGGGAGRPRPPGGLPCRARPAERDQGDLGGDGQPGPRRPRPGPAPGRDHPHGPVLRLHPRPARPIAWER